MTILEHLTASAEAADRLIAAGRHAPGTPPTPDSEREGDGAPRGAGEAARAESADPVATPSGVAVSPLQRISDNRPYRTPETVAPGAPDGALIVLPPGTLALLDEPAADPLDHAAAAFASASKSAATRRAYLSGLRYFEAWCRLDSSSALPATPPTVARYVTFLAGLGRSVSTIDQRVAAIAFAHRLDGHDSPTTSETVRTVLAGTQPFGGRRWWLICPDSGVRTSTLYMPDGAARFASRQVHRLGYRTQRLGDRGRAEERQVAALAALGGEAQAGGSIPDRPKGMRRDTYQRLLERARGGQGDQSFGSFGSP